MNPGIKTTVLPEVTENENNETNNNEAEVASHAIRKPSKIMNSRTVSNKTIMKKFSSLHQAVKQMDWINLRKTCLMEKKCLNMMGTA